ncbi:GNAT family N-acetyltransferase [Pelagicoccus sp. SDUM812003]|uniref:GNAT family N-acetyltransferase n=1 Tax=Pelagicoccus sp. SDUM812003 TaxID=3041267 RepID=UPI00280F2831|nr:GNAT family N-acetyltransferase [Pelagicoccus sp. SDUM812003]MDQ8204525.1 GNAT family N-acetyltransferase [Pelagicoccus sp. SDUM812003]
MDTEFRQFTTDDAEYQQSLELRNAQLRAPLGLELSESDTAGERSQLHFGLFRERRLLASVTLKNLGDGRMKLRQMVVEPSARGMGLGRALIENVEKRLRSMDCVEIVLAARVNAERFYETLGYRSSGERFREVGIDHLSMTKCLP